MTARGRHARALEALVGSLVAAALACGSDEGPEPRTIERFVERSTPLACAPRPDPSGEGWVVEDVVATSDSTFLALFPFDRRVGHYRHDGTVDFVLAFDRDGPLGIGEARSAALIGDSLVYVADRARLRVKMLGRDGRDRGILETGFPPYVVRSDGRSVFLGAFAFGGGAADLVHVFDGAGFRPLDSPVRGFDDPRVEALGNLVEVTPLADGTVVVAHQLIVSRALLVRPTADGFEVRETTVPVPSAERSRLGRAPRDLFEDEAGVDAIAVPVVGASADPRTGDYLYLTRSGRERPDGGRETAIVRADADLAYRASWLLDVDAQKIVYLAKRHAALVVDGESRWYECPIG